MTRRPDAASVLDEIVDAFGLGDDDASPSGEQLARARQLIERALDAAESFGADHARENRALDAAYDRSTGVRR